MVTIDMKNLIVGRTATKIAKFALEGENVNVVNCEEAVMSGTKEKVLAKFKRKRDMGAPLVGPYYPRTSNMIVRRIIRGMLPYKQDKGAKAFKKIKCYVGVPDKLKKEELKSFDKANVEKLPTRRFVKIKDVSKFLGAKQ